MSWSTAVVASSTRFEGFGEEDFVFVAVQGAEIEAGVEFGPDLLLGVLEGFGAEDIVDVSELVAGEGGEFGEGLEGAGALALFLCFGFCF